MLRVIWNRGLGTDQEKADRWKGEILKYGGNGTESDSSCGHKTTDY
jgi:hypothetical protein